MPSFHLNEFGFDFWDGPPPPVPTPKVTVTHQPGVSGVAHQILGTWADTFSVVLTSHWPSYQQASDQYISLLTLIGLGGANCIYNDLPWSNIYGVTYNVEAIDIIEIRAALQLIGPGYSYANGASLVVRATLTPQAT